MSGWSPTDYGLPLPWVDALVATGTTQATAFLLTKKINVFSTVGASSGALLPGSYAPGAEITVMNRGANALTLYPAPGDKIEAGSANAAISIAAAANATLMLTGNPLSPEPMQWRLVEAGLATGAYLPLAGGTVTGNLAVTGSLLTGAGTLSGLAYNFQSAVNFDPSTGPVLSRMNIFNTTLSYAGTSSNTWENCNSFTFISGPGIANGEINGMHSYHQVLANGNAQALNSIESSVDNLGTIGAFQGFLGLVHNFSAGTITQAYGVVLGLTNDNVAAGSVGNYAAILHNAKSGAGTDATNKRFILNNDTNGAINTMGGVAINTLTIPARGLLDHHGVDNSSGTVSVSVKNLAGQFAIIVQNDTSVLFANNLAKIDNLGGLTSPQVDYGTTGLTIAKSASKLSFYGGTPILKQTGVAVNAAAIHAALVSLGLFAA